MEASSVNASTSNDSVEMLCSALLYLMSRYSDSREPYLASEIAQHLSWLKDAARSQGCAKLDKTAERLLALHWQCQPILH